MNGNQHFGLISLTIPFDYKQLIIHGFAYETCANTSIDAGQTTGSCIPTSIENDYVSNRSVYSFDNAINIRLGDNESLGEVSVYSATGQLIHSSHLSKSVTQIQLNEEEGLYLVRVTSGNEESSDRIYIK